MPDHEKPHLASKKFVAFLVLTGGLLTLMGLMIALQEVSVRARVHRCVRRARELAS